MNEWVKRWGYEIRPEPVRRGVYRLRDGRFLVRLTVRDETGKRRDRMAVLPVGATLTDAMRKVEEIETAQPTAPRPSLPLFAVYAADLKDRKELRGSIASDAGRRKWTAILDLHLVPAFGVRALDEIRREHVQAWLDAQAALVQAGKAKPSTVNTRLALLRTVMRAAVADHGIADVTAGVEGLSTAEHPAYTEEEPNSLTMPEVKRFLEVCRESYPQHYALVLLGFVTGQRPSHLQPLRRRGPEADVLWEDGILLVRRSHSTGMDAMNTTKTKVRQRVALPREVVDVLRWHCTTQLRTDAQLASDLLFPSTTGTMLFTSSLTKPFTDVSKVMGLRQHFSPRGMRRTFQDLMREAGVHDLVARSISGHTTPAMQAHYSTVAVNEQRQAGARVVALLRPPTQAPASPAASHAEASPAGGACPRSDVG